MKINIYSLTDEEIEKRDYCNSLLITIDGKRVFRVYDGEPEDNNLNRNFNDCWRVEGLLERAYNAGKNGEEFSIMHHTVDEL